MSRNKIIPYNPEIRVIAQKTPKEYDAFRNTLMAADQEKTAGVQFHRQVPMDRFVVDFYCHEIMLAIEVDGRSHHNPKQAAKDVERQNILEGYGVQFIRITDEDVKKDMDGVVRYLNSKVVSLLE